MRPAATYRVQLRAEFGFDDAAALAGYLADLGISHLYCSPYLQAASGSTHGYDVVDPGHVNAELGGSPGLVRLAEALRGAGLGQVLDIVPNHMSTDPANRWWWDVLENGPSSRYARFFDIDWIGPDDRAAHTVLVPVLGDHYGRALERHEIVLQRDGGRFMLRYEDQLLPVSPSTLDDLLARAARRAGSAELAAIAEGLDRLPAASVTDPTSVEQRHQRRVALMTELATLLDASSHDVDAVDEEISAVNADVESLDELVRRQNYRLAHWRTASEELDYRRFFNIESLVGVRVEEPDVFAEAHRLILDLVADGTVDGLRVDHVDGLRDPERYLKNLATATNNAYTVVEKILGADESLPRTWPVAGTSGYDFLIRVNNVFVDSANEPVMTRIYDEFVGETKTYETVEREAKHHVMRSELAAEVERTTTILADLADRHRRHRDHTRNELRTAVRELVASFGIYRTYVSPASPATADDERFVREAVDATKLQRPDLDAELVDFLGELALGRVPGTLESEFSQRLQQLTAPVMAKGVEDTAFYRYHRLVSLNEVGGDPGLFGRPVKLFHADTNRAARDWPDAMLTLSTHDTKRSADVRARINVLSELPTEWERAVARWATITESAWEGHAPDRNAEYLLYQTLVGSWPISADRVADFMRKATKEAKLHTSWTNPDGDYDDALDRFVRNVVADDAFCDDLQNFLFTTGLTVRGRRNSLAQTALLLTCPGVPDIYQGTEMWDLSLVDPDNRRPVDYGERRAAMTATGAGTPELSHDESGTSKMRLIRALLQHRRSYPATFAASAYEPLDCAGVRADDLLAFARGDLAVVVPRLGRDDWSDTTVHLPSGEWTDVLSGPVVRGGATPAAELFEQFPVAVLVRPPR